MSTKKKDIQNNLLSSIANNIPFGVLCLDSNNKIVYINDTLLSKIGYSKIEFTNLYNEGGVLDNLQKEGLSFIYTKDKQLLQIIVSSKKIENDQTLNTITFFANDENEIFDVASFLQKIIDNIPDIISVQDINHNVLFYNKTAYNFLGITKEQAINEKCHLLMESKNICINCPAEKAKKAKKNRRTLRYYSKIDKWLDIRSYPLKNEEGEIVKIIEHIRDVSKEKKIEHELKLNEEKYRLLIENQNELIIKIDNHSRFKYVSATYCETFGMTESQLIDKSFIPTVHEDDIKQTNIAMSRLKHYPNTCYLEHRAMTANGWRWFAWSYKALTDIDANIVEIIGVGRDITKRKIIEFDSFKAQTNAEESNWIKTKFIENTSYELQTPINRILHFSELIAQAGIIKEERIRYASTIAKSGRELSKIVHNLIDIIHIEANQIDINFEQVDINHFLSEIYNSFFFEINKKGVEFILEKNSESALIISTDTKKLKQVLYNLINNSIQFTSQGYIHIGYKLEKDGVLFFVKDSGLGISKDEQIDIFDCYKQIKNKESTANKISLGLSVSKSLIELLGGEVQLKSAKGEGTSVEFTIPFKQTKRTKVVREVVDLDLSGYKILVAEDEKINFQLLQTILSKNGAEVIHAKSGLEVVSIMKENSNCDFIIMDIKMPGLTGSDALKEIRTFNSNIPIIACTAFAHEGKEELFYSQGFDAYIPKPVKRIVLFEKIAEILNKNTD